MGTMTQLLRISDEEGSTGIKMSIEAATGITKFGGHRRVVTTLLERLILQYNGHTVEINNSISISDSTEEIPFAEVALSSLLHEGAPRALLDFFHRAAFDGSRISIEECDTIAAVAAKVIQKNHKVLQAEERRREIGARPEVTSPGFLQFTMMFLALRNVWISGADDPALERQDMDSVDAAVLELMKLLTENAMTLADQSWLFHVTPRHYKDKRIVSLAIIFAIFFCYFTLCCFLLVL